MERERVTFLVLVPVVKPLGLSLGKVLVFKTESSVCRKLFAVFLTRMGFWFDEGDSVEPLMWNALPTKNVASQTVALPM